MLNYFKNKKKLKSDNKIIKQYDVLLERWKELNEISKEYEDVDGSVEKISVTREQLLNNLKDLAWILDKNEIDSRDGQFFSVQGSKPKIKTSSEKIENFKAFLDDREESIEFNTYCNNISQKYDNIKKFLCIGNSLENMNKILNIKMSNIITTFLNSIEDEDNKKLLKEYIHGNIKDVDFGHVTNYGLRDILIRLVFVETFVYILKEQEYDMLIKQMVRLYDFNNQIYFNNETRESLIFNDFIETISQYKQGLLDFYVNFYSKKSPETKH